MSNETRRLLLIEDDPFLIEWVERLRNEHFPDVEIVKVCSEREFLVRKADLANSGLKGIILDVMLPWEDGVDTESTDFTEPRGDYFEAGMRILDDIAQTPKLAAAAVLVHTVNDQSAVEIPRTAKLQITFLRKDAPDHRLLHWISRFI